MKKSLLLCLALVLVVFMVGCSNTKNERKMTTTNNTTTTATNSSKAIATVTTDKSQYSVNVSVIKLTVKNDSNDKLYFGEDFSLEKKVNNNWSHVPKTTKNSPDIICKVDKDKSFEVSFDIANQYSNLDKGEYRAVVELSKDKNDLSNTTKAYAKFTLK